MRSLALIVGPNGVGKLSVCRGLRARLPHAAWLESEWCRMNYPFDWNEATIALTTHNLTQMPRGYLTCAWVDVVVCSYGFHGPRRAIWDAVVDGLQDISCRLIPVALTCSEGENVARMTRDGRDHARIERALATRRLYADRPHPTIDTTHVNVLRVVEGVMDLIRSRRARPPTRETAT